MTEREQVKAIGVTGSLLEHYKSEGRDGVGRGDVGAWGRGGVGAWWRGRGARAWRRSVCKAEADF